MPCFADAKRLHSLKNFQDTHAVVTTGVQCFARAEPL